VHLHSSLATLDPALHFGFIFFALIFRCLPLAAAAKICSPHTISPNFSQFHLPFSDSFKIYFLTPTRFPHLFVLFLFGFNFVLHFSFPLAKTAKMLTRSVARGQGSGVWQTVQLPPKKPPNFHLSAPGRVHCASVTKCEARTARTNLRLGTVGTFRVA